MTEQQLIRKAQADYKREYRRKHPEKEKEARDRYWLRKAMEMYGLKEEDLNNNDQLETKLQTVNYTGTPFLSIKDTARVTGLSVYYLRQGVKAEEIPHIKSGKKILINVPRLLNKLEEE